MASDELSHAKQIKSWQTQMEAEEERAERMAGCLRTELEDKTQKLKVNLKTPSCDILLTMWSCMRSVCAPCTSS